MGPSPNRNNWALREQALNSALHLKKLKLEISKEFAGGCAGLNLQLMEM